MLSLGLTYFHTSLIPTKFQGRSPFCRMSSIHKYQSIQADTIRRDTTECRNMYTDAYNRGPNTSNVMTLNAFSLRKCNKLLPITLIVSIHTHYTSHIAVASCTVAGLSDAVPPWCCQQALAPPLYHEVPAVVGEGTTGWPVQVAIQVMLCQGRRLQRGGAVLGQVLRSPRSRLVGAGAVPGPLLCPGQGV